jgi:hypothetical protein
LPGGREIERPPSGLPALSFTDRPLTGQRLLSPAKESLNTGKDQMRTILHVCRLALPVGALLLCGAGGASAEVPADVQQACTPDAMRLCSDTIPDVVKTTACMNAKRAQLSQECRVAMAGGSGRRTAVRRVSRHYRHH